MRFWGERVVAHRAEHMALHVAVLVGAVGDVVERKIRDCRKRRFDFLIYFPLLSFKGRDRGFAFGNLLFELLSLALIPRLHCLMDFFRRYLAACSPTLKHTDNCKSAPLDGIYMIRYRIQPTPL